MKKKMANSKKLIAIIVSFAAVLSATVFFATYFANKPFAEVVSMGEISAEDATKIEIYTENSDGFVDYTRLTDSDEIWLYVRQINSVKVRRSFGSIDEKSDGIIRKKVVLLMKNGEKKSFSLLYKFPKKKFVEGTNYVVLGDMALIPDKAAYSYKKIMKDSRGFDNEELFSDTEGVVVFKDKASFDKSFDEWNVATSSEEKAKLAKIKDVEYGTYSDSVGEHSFFDKNGVIAVNFAYAADEDNIYASEVISRGSTIEVVFVINSPTSGSSLPTNRKLFFIDVSQKSLEGIENIEVKVLNLADTSRGSRAYEAAE